MVEQPHSRGLRHRCGRRLWRGSEGCLLALETSRRAVCRQCRSRVRRVPVRRTISCQCGGGPMVLGGTVNSAAPIRLSGVKGKCCASFRSRTCSPVLLPVSWIRQTTPPARTKTSPSFAGTKPIGTLGVSMISVESSEEEMGLILGAITWYLYDCSLISAPTVIGQGLCRPRTYVSSQTCVFVEAATITRDVFPRTSYPAVLDVTILCRRAAK